ncbi:MAG: hypothetical protein QXD23_03630 [Candidatus Micrarchaeaceae archaeon]
MPARVYTCDVKDNSELSKLMAYDPYLDKSLNSEQLAEIKKDPEANVIFARQDYNIKDGISLGLDRSKYYLYLSASEEFLEHADKKLKKLIKSIQRADKETEEKVITVVEGERSSSEEGLGSIFG